MIVDSRSVAVNGRAGNDGFFGGARQLVSDTRITLLLADEARDKVCARLFGVSKEDAALVTVIGLATLAGAADRKAHQILAAIGLRRSDAWFADGALNETFYRIGGDASREVPVIGSLILASVLLHRMRPVLNVSLHDLRVIAHRLRRDFDHRYGHLILPNRRRAIGA